LVSKLFRNIQVSILLFFAGGSENLIVMDYQENNLIMGLPSSRGGVGGG
jgi:hypothetical protein